MVNEKNNGEVVLSLINKDLVLAAHDVSNGGLIVSLSEMAMNSYYGMKIEKVKKLRNLFEYFFGEDQGRYILEVEHSNSPKVKKMLSTLIYKENIYTQKIF